MSNQVEETAPQETNKDSEINEILENLQKDDQFSESTHEGIATKEIDALKSEIAESKDKYLRLFAEFDNYKKRSIKERFELMKTAAQETIVAMLPVLDDFDRAKKSAEAGAENFSEGVQLVYNKLVSTLEQKGLKAMESTGVLFDAEFHEAITDIPAPTEAMKGMVIDTIEKGYILNDKIIRYAKVVVGK